MPVCSSVLAPFNFKERAFLSVIFLILVLVVVVPRGLMVAAVTAPDPSTVMSTATLAFSLKSSSKEGSLVILLPSNPFRIVTPLPLLPLAALPV